MEGAKLIGVWAPGKILTPNSVRRVFFNRNTYFQHQPVSGLRLLVHSRVSGVRNKVAGSPLSSGYAAFNGEVPRYCRYRPSQRYHRWRVNQDKIDTIYFYVTTHAHPPTPPNETGSMFFCFQKAKQNCEALYVWQWVWNPQPGDSIRALFIPESLEVTNNPLKGSLFHHPKQVTLNHQEHYSSLYISPSQNMFLGTGASSRAQLWSCLTFGRLGWSWGEVDCSWGTHVAIRYRCTTPGGTGWTKLS